MSDKRQHKKPHHGEKKDDRKKRSKPMKDSKDDVAGDAQFVKQYKDVDHIPVDKEKKKRAKKSKQKRSAAKEKLTAVDDINQTMLNVPSKSEMKQSEMQDEPPSVPIDWDALPRSPQNDIVGMSYEQFRSHCTEYPYKFYSEYLELKGDGPSGPFDTQKKEENLEKLRYCDVACYDATRVVLKDGDGGDFIHANFVDAYRHPKGFICTQGPMDNTIGDFWRMIYQEKCQVVFMTTKLEEDGQQKCAKYWPQLKGTEMRSGKIRVQNLDVQIMPGEYAITHLRLKHDDQPEVSAHVRHILYLMWPDKGLPKNAMKFIQFLQRLREVQKKLVKQMQPAWDGHPEGPPIAIHCSAGIGRTGTLAAMYTILRRLEIDGNVEVKETVRLIRYQRASMVQVVKQYVFLYTTLIEFLEKKDMLKFSEAERQQMLLPDDINKKDLMRVIEEKGRLPPNYKKKNE